MGLLDNIELFESLNQEQKDYFSNFFQEIEIKKGDFLLEKGDKLFGLYILLEGQMIITNSVGRGISFLNPGAMVGLSLLYNYGKKGNHIDFSIEGYQYSKLLIIPENIIKQLSDNDRNIFNKVLEQIRIEKRIL